MIIYDDSEGWGTPFSELVSITDNNSYIVSLRKLLKSLPPNEIISKISSE